MPVEQDVEDFKRFMINLGYIPKIKESSLTRLLNGRESFVFLNMIEKIRPKQEIALQRKQILQNLIKKQNNGAFDLTVKLPKELLNSRKSKDLQFKIGAADKALTICKEEVEELTQKSAEKSSKKSKLQDQLKAIILKKRTLQSRAAILKEKLQEDSELNRNIETTIKLLKPSETSGAYQQQVLNDAVTELQNYYKNLDPEITLLGQTKEPSVWPKKLRSLLTIGNNSVWNVINKRLDNELERIATITCPNDINTENAEKARLTSAFCKGTNKSYAKFLSLHLKLQDCIRKHEQFGEIFVTKYNDFSANFHLKMSLCNDDEHDAEAINTYLSNLCSSIFRQAQIEFLNKELALKQEEYQRYSLDNQVIDHFSKEALHWNEDIERKYIQINNDLMAFYQIWEKLLRSQKSHNYTVQNVEAQMANSSIIAGDFFCTSQVVDDSYCGNKLYDKELQLYNKINIGNLFGTEITYPLNSLLSMSGALVTADSAKLDIKEKCKWLAQLNERLNETVPYFEVPKVNFNALQGKVKKQNYEIGEYIDKILMMQLKANKAVDLAEKYYQFLEKFSMTHIIPRTLLFMNRNYQEYENEYEMHYKIIENALAHQT